MRRTREKISQVFLFFVALAVIGGGIAFYVKKRGIRRASISSPSSPSSAENKVDRAREPLEEAQRPSSDLPKVSMKIQFPVRNLAVSGNSRSASGVCNSIEFRGDGFQRTHVTPEDWKQVMKQFHFAKRRLQSWLDKHPKKMTEKTLVFMRSQLEQMKILRPPTLDEPDLSWRGIGVWTLGEKNIPSLRLNSGFIKLIHQYPQRAQFEMTRLVAQSWAPCELQRAGVESPWNSLLKCLDVSEEQACAAGSYSEGGWAISSVLAASISPPGCELPVFSHSKRGECLAK
jgi:hypothetical protein